MRALARAGLLLLEGFLLLMAELTKLLGLARPNSVALLMGVSFFGGTPFGVGLKGNQKETTHFGGFPKKDTPMVWLKIKQEGLRIEISVDRTEREMDHFSISFPVNISVHQKLKEREQEQEQGQEGLRRFWSIPLTRVPFWVPVF